jgi:hypothetical protein
MNRRWMALSLLGVALAVPRAAAVKEPPSEELRDPPEVRAAQGVTRVRLEARLETVEVGGRPVRTMVYNGLYAPPTIRVAVAGGWRWPVGPSRSNYW